MQVKFPSSRWSIISLTLIALRLREKRLYLFFYYFFLKEKQEKKKRRTFTLDCNKNSLPPRQTETNTKNRENTTISQILRNLRINSIWFRYDGKFKSRVTYHVMPNLPNQLTAIWPNKRMQRLLSFRQTRNVNEFYFSERRIIRLGAEEEKKKAAG